MFTLSDAKRLVYAGLNALALSVRDQPVDDALIASMKKRGSWQLAATLAREISTYIYAEPPAGLDDPFFSRAVSAGVVTTLKSPEYRKRVAADPDFAKLPGFLD